MLPSPPHTYQYGEEGKVLRCPWHGYEFRLTDGHAVLRPDTMRVRTYRVEVEDEEVVVYV
jgi:nitrite reductase/ring-hydroxylating ferredoxin subunit